MLTLLEMPENKGIVTAYIVSNPPPLGGKQFLSLTIIYGFSRVSLNLEIAYFC